MLFLSDLRVLAISLQQVVYFLGGFKNFWSLDFLVWKDCIVSYKEKETWKRGQTRLLYIYERNKARKRKVL